MLNIHDSNLIASICYKIDMYCRIDLSNGSITREPDYVSNLASHLRHPFGPFFRFSIASAATLASSLETTFGCDSIIIFTKGNYAKVGLFEAKWPRYFNNPNYRWDSPNTSGNSRFTSQIERQNLWTKSGAFIWEMFFNESMPVKNRPFDEIGSSCLTNFDANQYMSSHIASPTQLWDNSDLIRFLPAAMSFKRIIYNMLRCNWGKRIMINNNAVTLNSNDKSMAREIPVPRDIQSNSIIDNPAILNFMEENGLQNYIVFQLDKV